MSTSLQKTPPTRRSDESLDAPGETEASRRPSPLGRQDTEPLPAAVDVLVGTASDTGEGECTVPAVVSMSSSSDYPFDSHGTGTAEPNSTGSTGSSAACPSPHGSSTGTRSSSSESPSADVPSLLATVEGVTAMKREAWLLLTIAAPGALASFANLSSPALLSAAVAHRLGAEGLEAMAAGYTTYTICSASFGIGMITGLDTLASQAFGRDKKNPELGELLQRVTIIMALFALPCFAFFYFSGAILPLVFSAKLAQGASLFLNNCYVYLAIALFNYIIFSLLNACRLTHIPFIGALAGVAVVGVMSYYIVDSLPTAAWTLTAGVVVNTLVMIYIASWHPDTEGIRRTQWPLSPNALKMDRIREFFAVALPAMVACCGDWWSAEVLMLLAATVSDAAVGVLTIFINIMYLCIPLSAGLARATSTLVGNALGENNPELARLRTIVPLLMILAAQSVLAVVILVFGRLIFQLWTDDEELLSLFPSVHICLAVSVLADGLQFAVQGSYRGVGKQDMLAKRVLISMWPVGLGCAYFFAHSAGLGVGGIVLGNACGLSAVLPLLLYGMKGWDWRALALKASEEKGCIR